MVYVVYVRGVPYSFDEVRRFSISNGILELHHDTMSMDASSLLAVFQEWDFFIIEREQ